MIFYLLFIYFPFFNEDIWRIMKTNIFRSQENEIPSINKTKGVFFSISGCNDWYTQSENNLHVTIGRYQGTEEELERFHQHLDADLRGNIDRFPVSITSATVELSEEMPFHLRRRTALVGDSTCDTDIVSVFADTG